MQLQRAVATECCKHYHFGKRCKIALGPYHQHPIDVADQLRNLDEKVLALVHDVIEDTVKDRWGKHLSREAENKYIKQVIEEVARYFSNRGCALDRDMLQDLNILTRRTYYSYETYIGRIKSHVMQTGRTRVAKVKIADLRDNQRPDRNRPERNQSPEDKLRLSRYKRAEATLLECINRREVRNARHRRYKGYLNLGRRPPPRVPGTMRLDKKYGWDS